MPLVKKGTCALESMISRMNRAQRVVLFGYCLLILYGCLWIPWRVPNPAHLSDQAGFGWIWAGPQPRSPGVYMLSSKDPAITFVDQGNQPVDKARPDVPAIMLRMLFFTFLGVAAFLACRPLSHTHALKKKDDSPIDRTSAI